MPRESWITFHEVASSAKTKRFQVRTKDGATLLGEVRFFPRWRRFSFYPNPDTLYEQDCLRDIADFCEEQTHVWRLTRMRGSAQLSRGNRDPRTGCEPGCKCAEG